MTHPAGPPRAEGRRLPWTAIPPQLRAEVERIAGGRIVSTQTQSGGFSPDRVAARLVLDGGRRAFVKAVGDINPDSPGIHRAEARVAAALPATTPAARLLGTIDAQGWVVLVFEDVGGHLPEQPWRPDELARVLAAMGALAAALTPAPVEVPPAPERLPGVGHGWQDLAAAAHAGAATGDLHPWARAHLDDLAELETGWGGGVAGTSLAHGDIRADNILLAGDRVVFVDWPWACLAAPWFDLAGFLPSVAMQGGPSPESVFARHPAARGADPVAVTAVVAAIAGMWTSTGRRPDPPGLPTVRAFQRAQGDVALAWLRERDPGF